MGIEGGGAVMGNDQNALTKYVEVFFTNHKIFTTLLNIQDRVICLLSVHFIYPKGLADKQRFTHFNRHYEIAE